MFNSDPGIVLSCETKSKEECLSDYDDINTDQKVCYGLKFDKSACEDNQAIEELFFEPNERDLYKSCSLKCHQNKKCVDFRTLLLEKSNFRQIY